MSNTWFTSDTHFCHHKVAELRNFGTTEEHDAAITRNWNSVVKPQDIVWHLGDVAMNSDAQALHTVSKLNGSIHLISGNHDSVWPGHKDGPKKLRMWLGVFRSVQPFAKIKVEGMEVLLSHFPYSGDHTREERFTQYRLRDEGKWLLHGHIHQPNVLTSDHSIHVGLDAWDLFPANSRNIAAIMKERR